MGLLPSERVLPLSSLSEVSCAADPRSVSTLAWVVLSMLEMREGGEKADTREGVSVEGVVISMCSTENGLVLFSSTMLVETLAEELCDPVGDGDPIKSEVSG